MIQNLFLKYRKAVAALLGPVVVAGLGAGASWVVTGNFSDTEIRTAASGALLGLAGLITTAVAKPNLPVAVGVGSDDLLAEATDSGELAPPLDPERIP